MSKFSSLIRFENFTERYRDSSLKTLTPDQVSVGKVSDPDYLINHDFMAGFPIGTYGFKFSYRDMDAGKDVFLMGTPTPWGNVVAVVTTAPGNIGEAQVQMRVAANPLIKSMRLTNTMRPEAFLQFWFNYSDEKSGWTHLYPHLKGSRLKKPQLSLGDKVA